MKNYYKILGIDYNSNYNQIKKAYLEKKLNLNANRFIHQEEKEKKLYKLRKAYHTLKDFAKRTKYNKGLNQHNYSINNLFPESLNLFDNIFKNIPKSGKSNYYQSTTVSSSKLQPDGTYLVKHEIIKNDNGKKTKKNKKYIIDKFGKKHLLS